MTITEQKITNAAQSAASVVKDLEAVLKRLIALPLPPEGRSMQSLATTAYVGNLLDAARKLQSDLAKISD